MVKDEVNVYTHRSAGVLCKVLVYYEIHVYVHVPGCVNMEGNLQYVSIYLMCPDISTQHKE